MTATMMILNMTLWNFGQNRGKSITNQNIKLKGTDKGAGRYSLFILRHLISVISVHLYPALRMLIPDHCLPLIRLRCPKAGMG